MSEVILPALPLRWYQHGVFRAYSQGVRRFLYTWPRRHGKDVTMFQLFLMEGMRRVGNLWYLFPTRAWAERAIWNNTQELIIGGKKRSGKLVDILIPEGLPVTKHEKDLKITLPNGSVIQFSGTENLDFIGQGGTMYGLSEYPLHRADVTSYISPILEEAGALLVLQGTLRGKQNHLYRNFEKNFTNSDWFTQWLTPELTKLYCWVGDELNVNPELLGKINPETGRKYTNIQDLVDAGEISHALALQEYLNRATLQNETGYYSREYSVAGKEGRLHDAEYDPRLPVYTFWDLGKGTAQKCTDAMAVWFVQFPKDDLPKPKQINMIDFHESVGKQWADYARILNSKGFMYGNHYAPWDIHKGIAGLDGNNLQWAKDAGIDFQPVTRSGSVMEAIELCRRLWRFLHFAPKCSDALDRLASYHEKTNRNGFGMGVPDHTLEESNVADSYRTMVEALARNIVRPRNMMRDDFSWFECPKFDGYFDG